MTEQIKATGFSRRALLAVVAAAVGATGFADATLASPPNGSDEALELIKSLTGKTPIESDRVRLLMPPVFPNGYTVPLELLIDSPMTEADHVRHVRILASRNPLVMVATVHFVPQRSQPRISTRIRLAQPQEVIAVAEMNDGTLLMARQWVEVATDGCA